MTSEKKLGQLISDGHLFVFAGSESLEVWANANDTFGWGTASAEPIKWIDEDIVPDIEGIHTAIYSGGRWDYVKWLCRHRGQPPMPEIIRDMKKDGQWPFEPFSDQGEAKP